MPISDDQLSDPNLKAIYDLGIATRDDIKELSQRFDKHSGEGTDTTHAALDKRQDKVDKRIGYAETKLYGVYAVAATMGAFIMAKWRDIFGG